MEFKNAALEHLIPLLQRVSAALRQADVPFMLGGSLAAWVRGGPESGNDLDIMLKQEDAPRALEALERIGMECEKPPQGWLYKARLGEETVDLIFDPTGVPITDEVLERADCLQVYDTDMLVLSLEDLLVSKILSLKEHDLSLDSLLAMARALREQVDWDNVWHRSKDSPYARGFFHLLDELEILDYPLQSA